MRTGRRGRGRGGAADTPARQPNYRQLKNPFPPMKAFSDDHIVAMHNAGLDILEEQGMKVLLSEARAIFKAGGARVDEDSEMVFIGR